MEKQTTFLISDLMQIHKPTKKEKAPPHELSAVVDEIQKVLGFKTNDKYGYKYWLSKAKGISYNQILGILKEIQGVDAKYNKGGLLTNKILKLKGKK